MQLRKCVAAVKAGEIDHVAAFKGTDKYWCAIIWPKRGDPSVITNSMDGGYKFGSSAEVAEFVGNYLGAGVNVRVCGVSAAEMFALGQQYKPGASYG